MEPSMNPPNGFQEAAPEAFRPLGGPFWSPAKGPFILELVRLMAHNTLYIIDLSDFHQKFREGYPDIHSKSMFFTINPYI